MTPIRTLLDSLSDDQFQQAYDVLYSFMCAIRDFPKPVGIQDMEMSETELERYHDGWNAAMDAHSFLFAMLFNQMDEFLKQFREQPKSGALGGAEQKTPPDDTEAGTQGELSKST
jgi:hypothetical protein